MKKILFRICMAVAAVLPAAASATEAPVQAALNRTQLNVTASRYAVERSENMLFVSADINIDSVNRGSNRELWIKPEVVGESRAEQLPAVVLAGRNRFYQAQRLDLAAKENFTLLRDNYKDHSYTYTTTVPYEKWMHGAELKLIVELRGCCSDSIERQEIMLTHINVEPPVTKFVPVFNWITPQAEAQKTRELRGQAYIDFPVNKIVIYPEYRRNTVELAKIRATIDSVHQDPDITITALSIKGYASPEGPWNNNVRLAKGRTAALKTYVEDLYHFEKDFIKTDFDPEDWGGLRAYVEKSNIANREGILSLIDSSLEPDAKDAKIKSTYPQQYAFLLAEVYPALRHSDYRIEYTIRSFSDVKEILELVKTRPQKLSLQEFFLAAKSVEPGSEIYNDIFETAVRMYPDSEVANLNAANAAMGRGDYTAAARYLAKAGDDPTVIYAAGVLTALQGDYDTAREKFEAAARLRVADAPAALRQLEQMGK